MTKKSLRTKLPVVVLITTIVIPLHGQSSQKSAAVTAQSQTEADALLAVNRATNPTTKLAAAEEFVARFPRSSSRLKIAELVTAELRKVQNPDAALILLQRAKTIFTEPAEQDTLKRVAFETYANSNHTDEAFRLAGELLAQNPDDLQVLVQMAFTGAHEAKKKNRKHEDVALQAGETAIALIEAGKKPSSLSDDFWTNYKGYLGKLYQQTAILNLSKGNVDQAKQRLHKAISLQPRDPTNYALLGRVLNSEYEKELASSRSLPEGNAKQEKLKACDEALDAIINAYARAIALATGRPEYQQLIQQLIPDLTTYYKSRHNQSTAGLQQLINGFRRR